MPLTEDEEFELLSLERERAMGGQTQLTPAQEFSNEHPIIRTVGRTGRNAAVGIASLPDLGLLVPKTAALMGSVGAEKMGLSKTADVLGQLGRTPTVASMVEGSIDRATGNRLKPINGMEKAFDIGGQMISSSVPFMKGPQALNAVAPKPPTAGTALTSVLDPETALGQLPKVQAMATPKAINSETQRQIANAAYTKAKEYGGILKPEATDGFLDKITKEVLPQTAAGRVVAGSDTPVAKVMQRMEALRGQPLSLDEVQEIDEILGEAIDGEFGIKGLSKQGKKILDIQNSFRNMVEEADETMVAGTKEGFDALAQGRQEWAKLMKMRDVERIISRAEMSQQPANAIKSGFKTLYNNEKRMRGFNKEEAAFIKKMANEGAALELLRGPASRLFGIGMAVKGGPVGYALGKGAEMGARSLREQSMLARTDNLMNLIGGYKPPVSTPLLTNQGALGAIAGANTAGQQMLPKPSPLLTYQGAR